MNSSSSNPSQSPTSRIRRLLTLALPVLIVLGGLAVAVLLMSTRPTAQRAVDNKPKAESRLVTVTPAELSPATMMIAANGSVQAAQSTELRARVSGQVVALADHLAPGTRFKNGDVLARIDPADYRLALTQAKSQLASAKASLATENGQQAVAKRELNLVGNNVSQRERNLALRGPQLATARADVDSAKSQVDQARLDLARTDVTAPFSGMVTARSASIGDVVSTADTLATLAATNNYWVDVSLPVDQLRWLHAPAPGRPGSVARIYYPDAWGDDVYLDASVLRIQGQLEANGRLARVLLQAPDPLGDGSDDTHQLLLGAYVSTKIAARMPANSVLIDSAYLRENNEVWLFSDQHTLDIRKVTASYRDATRAVISQGLKTGDEVITSELSAPIQGMPIRVETGPLSAPADAAPTDRNNDPSRQAKTGLHPKRAAVDAHNDSLKMAPALTTFVTDQPTRAAS